LIEKQDIHTKVKRKRKHVADSNMIKEKKKKKLHVANKEKDSLKKEVHD
jgi:hypothetical protein